MNRLNIEIVKQAVDQLKAKGIKPTNKAIVEQIGYGSFSTLTQLRKQYPSVFDTTVPKQSTVKTPHIVSGTHNAGVSVDSGIVDVIWSAIIERVDTLIEDKLDIKRRKASDLNDLAQLRDLWLDAVGQLSSQESQFVDSLNRENELQRTITELKERIAELTDLLEDREARLKELEKKVTDLESTPAELNDMRDYKERYFQLIEENGRIKEGLWPAETTPDGYQKLSVKEIALPSALIPKLRDFAHKHCEGSQHEAVARLVSAALDADLPPAPTKAKAPDNKRGRKTGNDAAKARLKKLKELHPSWSLTALSVELAKEGYLDRKGQRFRTGTLSRWLSQKA